MVTVFVIIAVILFEIILIIFGTYFLLKKLRKQENVTDKIQVKVQGNSVSAEVIRDGVKAAMQELACEKEEESLFIKKMKKAEHIYSNVTPNDAPVKHAGGYLVPFNLTDEEKAAVEMFYAND